MKVDHVRMLYETGDKYADRTGQSIALGHDQESDMFGFSVVNVPEGMNAYAVLDRTELLALRDAITRRLAQ